MAYPSPFLRGRQSFFQSRSGFSFLSSGPSLNDEEKRQPEFSSGELLNAVQTPIVLLRFDAGFILGADLPSRIPKIGSNSACTCLFGSHFSDATAYIPSLRPRAEKAPLEQSKLLTCCNLTRKRKRTRPCNDYPTSSLDIILRVPQAVV